MDKLTRADSQETQKRILETFAKDLPITNRLHLICDAFFLPFFRFTRNIHVEHLLQLQNDNWSGAILLQVYAHKAGPVPPLFRLRHLCAEGKLVFRFFFLFTGMELMW